MIVVFYEVRFGAPFPFIEQTSWLTPFEEDFPLNLTVLSPWENPTRILPGNMVLSVISISVMLLRVKPSKPNSLLAAIVGVVFVIIGITTFLPMAGFFGVIWTLEIKETV